MARSDGPSVVTLIVPKAEVEGLRTTEAFVHALRLARVVNTLRFLIDAATTEVQVDRVEAIRARTTGGLLLAAAVYEALYVLDDKDFQRATETLPGIAALRALRAAPAVNALKKGYLAFVRNKFAFHVNARHLRDALKRDHPEQVIAWQRELLPDSGVFYVLPELDVILSVPEADLPTEADVEGLQRGFPHTHRIALPPVENIPELRRYFRALSAVYVLAFALCDAVDALLLPLMKTMVQTTPPSSREGAPGAPSGAAE